MQSLYLILFFVVVPGIFIARYFFVRQRNIELVAALNIYKIEFDTALKEFDCMLAKPVYICDSQYQLWRNKFHNLIELLPPNFQKIKIKDPLVLKIKCFLDSFSNGRALFLDPHNENFIKSETPIIKRVLSEKRIQNNGDQINAIASDEDNTLLVAGAGTGKTTTILGKLAYLIERVGVDPKDILLLSFTGRAVNELSDRITKKFADKNLEARTFHSFGLSVIGQVRGKKPDLAFDGAGARQTFLNDKFDELLNNQDYLQSAIEYFAYYFKPIELEPGFETLDEYYKNNKIAQHITLRNEKVKSQQEVMLANFFFINGINYNYEAPYKHETATNKFRQYKPDFYLSDYDIYIEHFGVDEHGMVHFTQNSEQNRRESIKYRADMEWKRALHTKYQTKLIETYSYEFFLGDWMSKLTAKLQAHNVILSKLNNDEILSALRKDKDVKQIAELFATFLDLCKSNCYSLDRLRGIVADRNNPRESAFIRMFAPLYSAYEEYLKLTGTIDFHDMLLEAALYISEGRFDTGYKYIIIDEFQDFSVSKSKLIKALCDQHPHTKLFCVGDDWQSIFRFAGSDVSLMTDFEGIYGFTRKNQLVVTNRFNDRLAAISNQFILKNPTQIHKEVRSDTTVDFDPIEIIHERNKRETDHFLREILGMLNREAKGAEKIDVLLLGRYKHNRPDYLDIYKKEFSNLSTEFLTVHAAKGTEADYVIILDVCSGRYGFPSEISDDPILDIVLSKREQYPNAEERRLMYVAMTRAKRKVYILTQDGAESTFVLELERASGAKKEKMLCQACGGEMKQRNGPYGVFYGCSNYPSCDSKINIRRSY
jgi:DNA helicase-4